MISIIILTHGNVRWLAACLRSCLEQDYNHFEVIIVNDTPRNQEKIAQIIVALGCDRRIRTISLQPCSIGEARNIGVKAADGSIIAFVDDDCILPDNHWLSTMLSKFDSTVNVVYTLGKFHRDDPAIVRYGILCNPYFPGQNIGTAHTLLKKVEIIRAGCFPTATANEDIELISKIPGNKIYVPECAVYHYHATTITQYLKKQWRNITATQGTGQAGNQMPMKDLLKFRATNFFKVFTGEADLAWLLWPLIDGCSALFILYAKVTR